MLHAYLSLGVPSGTLGLYYMTLSLLLTVVLQSIAYTAHREYPGVVLCAIATLSHLVHVKYHAHAIVPSFLLFVFGAQMQMSAERPIIRHPIAQTVWIWSMSAQVVIENVAVTVKETKFVPLVIGSFICILAIIGIVNHEILSRYSRNPRHAMTILFAMGLSVCAAFGDAVPLLFFAISFIAVWSSMRNVERERSFRMCSDPMVMNYKRTTSPLVPLPEGWYERLPRFVQMFICLEAH